MLEVKYKAVILKGKNASNQIHDVLAINFKENTVQLSGCPAQRSLKSVSLLPYTQIRDSDGKELYLGDLVRCHHDEMIREVDWNYEDCGFILREYGETRDSKDETKKRFMDPLYFSDTKVTFYANKYDGTTDERDFVQYI